MQPDINRQDSLAARYAALGAAGTRFRIYAPPGVQRHGEQAGTLGDFVAAPSSRCLFAGYRYECPLAGFDEWSWAPPPASPQMTVTSRQGGNNFAGQYYTLFRHYDPNLMRFTSPDPAAQLFYNLYGYCGNNPGRFVDPDGDIFFLIPALMTAGIIGGGIALTADTAVQYSEHTERVTAGTAQGSFVQNYDAGRGAKWTATGAAVGVVAAHVAIAGLFTWEIAPAAGNVLLQSHIAGTAAGGGTTTALLARLIYGQPSGTSTATQRTRQAASTTARISQTYTSSTNSESGNWTVAVRGYQGRLPSADRGQWTGVPGHSTFVPSDPKYYGLQPGQNILFRNGRPDFGPFSKGTLNVSGMTGEHAHDMPLIHRQLALNNGWLKLDGTPNASTAASWLRTAQLTPHHAFGDKVLLVPSQLHRKLSHDGSALDLRQSGR